MFSLSSLIARRYLFSKKSHSVINIISVVSLVAVGIPVAGMIILLSVFNGFEQIVRGMYNAFDPDIRIEAAEGKFFDAESFNGVDLREINGVEQCAYVLEDNVLVEYRGRQEVIRLMGVDSLYSSIVPLGDMVARGEYKPMLGYVEQALVGMGVAYKLGVNVNLYDQLKVYTPSNASVSSLLPLSGYREGNIRPSGVFVLDASTDGQYIIVPMSFASRIFDKTDSYSSVIVQIAKGADSQKVKAVLQQKLGDGFLIQTRFEQKAEMYRIMTYEKWGIFFIIALVMVIASFSIIGSLIMLILDKKKDTQTLIILGADLKLAHSVFIKEGMLISTLGSFFGLILGLAFCFLQQFTGFIKIPSRTFMVDSYPVVVSFFDVLMVVALFFIVNYVITLLTVKTCVGKSNMKI